MLALKPVSRSSPRSTKAEEDRRLATLTRLSVSVLRLVPSRVASSEIPERNLHPGFTAWTLRGDPSRGAVDARAAAIASIFSNGAFRSVNWS